MVRKTILLPGAAPSRSVVCLSSLPGLCSRRPPARQRKLPRGVSFGVRWQSEATTPLSRGTTPRVRLGTAPPDAKAPSPLRLAGALHMGADAQSGVTAGLTNRRVFGLLRAVSMSKRCSEAGVSGFVGSSSTNLEGMICLPHRQLLDGLILPRISSTGASARPFQTSEVACPAPVSPLWTSEMACPTPVRPFQTSEMACRAPVRPFWTSEVACPVPVRPFWTSEMVCPAPVRPFLTSGMACPTPVSPFRTSEMPCRAPVSPFFGGKRPISVRIGRFSPPPTPFRICRPNS